MNDPSKVPAASYHYDASYRNFDSDLYARVRKEACGEDDLGQTSWITAKEQDRVIEWLKLGPGKSLLDVACGSGGPTLRVAERSGCAVTGVDTHEAGIAAARSQVKERGMNALAEFAIADASKPLPFPDASFDAITCIDAINHLTDRQATIRDWTRLLKPGGRLLYTDPTTITGPLTGAELRVRSSIGPFLFVPQGYDRRVIEECGLRILAAEDATDSMARLAEGRRRARAAHREELIAIEGESSYEAQQEFFEVASRIARERRLSRFLFVAEK